MAITSFLLWSPLFWSPLNGIHQVRQGYGCVVQCQTQDWKVAGSVTGRSSSRNFFSTVNFLCWLLAWYPLHTRVTSVAPKRPWSFCHKCRRQITAKSAYTLDPNIIRVGSLLCPGIVLEPTREMSSHAIHQEALIHCHPSSLHYCRLLLDIKEWNWCLCADHYFTKKKKKKKKIQVRNDSLNLSS